MTAAPQGETETGLSSKGQLSLAKQRPALAGAAKASTRWRGKGQLSLARQASH